MSERNDGGPAFPGERTEKNGKEIVNYGHGPKEVDSYSTTQYTGMSLRDYFAAKALTGLLSGFDYNPEGAAEDAYRHADAMLKQRENDK